MFELNSLKYQNILHTYSTDNSSSLVYENIFLLHVPVKLVLYWYIILIEHDWELTRMLRWVHHNFRLASKKKEEK